MKQLLLTAFMCTMFCSMPMQAESETLTILTLENEVLALIDGHFITGTTVGMMMQLRIDVNKRRLGVKTSTGLIGKYSYKNKSSSIQQLKDIEQAAAAGDIASLRALLKEIKDELVAVLRPFLDEAKGAKGQMVALIAEWAQKAHRPDSQLLEWAKSKDENETQSSYNKITSFKLLDRFCGDLVHFLETLLRSCPNACQQFKTMMEQKQKEQHTA